jgi:hypothetical protein
VNEGGSGYADRGAETNSKVGQDICSQEDALSEMPPGVSKGYLEVDSDVKGLTQTHRWGAVGGVPAAVASMPLLVIPENVVQELGGLVGLSRRVSDSELMPNILRH